MGLRESESAHSRLLVPAVTMESEFALDRLKLMSSCMSLV